MNRQSWYATSENSDPYANTWTQEQQNRKRLKDTQIMRDNYEQTFVGMPTTKEVVKLGEYDDEIKRLTQELGIGDRTSTQNVAAPMSAPDTKPFVPTMTEPIQRYSQPEAAPTSTEQPEYELYGPAKPEPTVAEQIQQAQREAERKRLERLGVLVPEWIPPQNDSGNAGSGYISFNNDVPTMEDIEAAYQESQAKPYTPGVEGGDIGDGDNTDEAEERAEAAKIKYAEDLWLQFINSDSILYQDAFLESRDFSTGRDGYLEIWNVMTVLLGKDEFEKFREDLKPESTATFISPEAYEEMANTPPSIEGDYGTINIGGEDVQILPWSWEHNKHTYDVIDTYNGKVTEWSLANFMLDMNFEEGEKDTLGNDVGAGGVNGLLLVHKVLSSFKHSYISVDVIEIEGQKRAVVKVSDSNWNSVWKEPDRTIYDLNNGTIITLDEDHNESEFGYIYFEDGKMILKPVIYPGDKYQVFKDNKYVDVTNQMRREYEVPGEMADWIEEAINKAGLSF